MSLRYSGKINSLMKSCLFFPATVSYMFLSKSLFQALPSLLSKYKIKVIEYDLFQTFPSGKKQGLVPLNYSQEEQLSSPRLALHHPRGSSIQTCTLPGASVHGFPSAGLPAFSLMYGLCRFCLHPQLTPEPPPSGSPPQPVNLASKVHAQATLSRLHSHLLVLIPYIAARVDFFTHKYVGLLCYLNAVACR